MIELLMVVIFLMICWDIFNGCSRLYLLVARQKSIWMDWTIGHVDGHLSCFLTDFSIFFDCYSQTSRLHVFDNFSMKIKHISENLRQPHSGLLYFSCFQLSLVLVIKLFSSALPSHTCPLVFPHLLGLSLVWR